MGVHVVRRLSAGAVMALALAVLPACRTLRGSTAAADSLALTPEEQAFARALAHYVQGLIYEIEDGRYAARAVEQYYQAAELDPSQPRLYSKVAAGALLQGTPEKAVGVLEAACRADRRSAGARLDLGTVYQISGDLKRAARCYAEAARLAPTNATAHLALANLLFHEDQPRQALRAVRGALREVDAAAGKSLLGFCYSQGLRFLRDGKPAAADRCFHFVIRHAEAERPYLCHLVGEAHEAADRRTAAIAWFRRAVRQKSPLPHSYVKLALLHLNTEPERAIALLWDGHRRLPEDLLVLLALAQIYGAQERYDEALQVFEQVVTLAGDAPQKRLTASFFLQYGVTCERAGLLDKAEQVFRRGLELYPQAHEILNYLAYTWADKGVNLEEALDFVLRALKEEPENGAYLDTLGWVYFKQRKYPEALEQIQKAEAVIPDDPTIAEHLGDICEALGRREEAIAAWKRSYRRDPGNRGVAARLEAAGIAPAEVLKEAAAPALTPAAGE
jgi:tetratricopeptide (TPR) repeat protein